MSRELSPSRRRRGVRLLAAAALLAGAATGLAAPSASAAPVHPSAVVGGTDLGPNVYLFTPDMPQADIQTTVDTIAAQQLDNQFGTQRYSLLFAPGTYGSVADPLVFQVGYYTEVAGLGKSPDDTVINGSVDVYNQCDADNNCLALNNFWRSLSNLQINVAGGEGCHANTEFWAVSQAASMRRVDVRGGTSFMDYCSNPAYASGGFVADSNLQVPNSGAVVSGSQQQFLVRNSKISGWSNGVWNQVFVGVDGAPAEDFGGAGTNQYTTVDTTPVEQEKPYLFLSGNQLKVFVPSAATATTGTTWASGATPGMAKALSTFFVATPSNTVAQMNAALAGGQNLLLTPGVYHLASSLQITRRGTIVLGLGLATLVPTNASSVITVSGVPGVKISGLILDAGPKKSPTLLTMAPSTSVATSAPDVVQDVYFRIGGATAGSAAMAADIGSSHTVLDNIWAWRADHGTGVGWTQNVAGVGVRVTGDNDIAYGLFVEHFQRTEVVWSGINGQVFMFQNEMPYDVPSQSAWMSGPNMLGYPALAVTSTGSFFHGFGMGSYSFFNQGLDIHASRAFSVPKDIGVALHDSLTIFLNGDGGIDHVVNNVGAPVNSSFASTPSIVVDAPLPVEP